MSRKTKPVQTTFIEVNRLKGKRFGGSLKEQVWLENGEIVSYSLVYINRNRCRVDHGRVLGYDNSHGYHHRHFMGKVEAIDFTDYADLARRFYGEVHELWRLEDEKDSG